MKVRKVNGLIFRLRILYCLCCGSTIFLSTFAIFVATDLIILGVDYIPFLMTLAGHSITYIFKFRKYVLEIEPEKRKIDMAIYRLKSKCKNGRSIR